MPTFYIIFPLITNLGFLGSSHLLISEPFSVNSFQFSMIRGS